MASSLNRPGLPARLSLLALSVAMSMATGTVFARSTNPVALFDEAVAMGLPGTVAFPAPAHRGRNAVNESELVVESPLAIQLRFPDDVPGTMYRAIWRGEPAVVTRSGNHLDISVPRSDGVDVTGFSSDTDEIHHVRPTAQAHGDQDMPNEGSATARSAHKPHDNTAQATPRPAALPTLIFWMFIHDDVRELSREHIHASYVAWWIADMDRILPLRSLWVVYSEQQEGMTDVAYGTASSLSDWSATVDAYATTNKLPRYSGKYDYKFMLITKDEPVPGLSGQAWLGGDTAIASLGGRYNIIAHEYGHTLGAVHADAEVRWTFGWPCETNVVSDPSSLRSNCYRYSSANERRMRSYAAREWTVPVNPNPLEIPLGKSAAAMTIPPWLIVD